MQKLRLLEKKGVREMVYAVIDTNIFVSALITHHSSSATVKILNYLSSRRIIPLYNDEIIAEYDEVLHRKKFKLPEEQISALIEFIKRNGIDSERFPFDGDMPDEDDRVFYEVALSEEDSFLVTGNLKHFPKVPKVVTAAKMIEILEQGID